MAGQAILLRSITITFGQNWEACPGAQSGSQEAEHKIWQGVEIG